MPTVHSTLVSFVSGTNPPDPSFEHLDRPPFTPPHHSRHHPPPALVRRQTSNRDVEVFLPSAEASMRFAFSQLSRLPPGGVKWPSQSPSGGSLTKKRLPGGGGPPGGAEVVSGVRFFLFFFFCLLQRARAHWSCRSFGSFAFDGLLFDFVPFGCVQAQYFDCTASAKRPVVCVLDRQSLSDRTRRPIDRDALVGRAS